MNAVALAAEQVPERHYTHHEGRGPTPHRSNPSVIHRELTTLDLQQHMRVAEYGTGSGYSTELIARLVGPGGEVTSVDIDAYLTRWPTSSWPSGVWKTPTATPPTAQPGSLNERRTTGWWPGAPRHCCPKHGWIRSPTAD